MSDFVYCGFWDGDCKAIMTDDCQDAKKIKREWLRDGADEIRKLPTEEGKAALMGWIQKRRHQDKQSSIF